MQKRMEYAYEIAEKLQIKSKRLSDSEVPPVLAECITKTYAEPAARARSLADIAAFCKRVIER